MERNKQKLVETLTRGRNSAKRLQNILRRKVNDDGLVSVDDLVTEIQESFYGGLLVLGSCNSSDLCRVPVSSYPVKEQRRGCYKRRYLMCLFVSSLHSMQSLKIFQGH